ncbi:MAG: dihydrodipicolinate reductase C-terminal domain-containing protein [Pseudomonadota bacterium]
MTQARPRLVVHGAGRMGRLVAAAASAEGFQLQALVSRQHPGDLDGAQWRPGLDALGTAPDLLIDFTLPSGTVAAARWCAAQGVPLVSGTTGLEALQARALERAATQVPVLHAANFSPGVNAMLGVLESLGGLGIRSARLTDVHHIHKKDAPSGTALALAAALAPVQVAIESRREGEVIGDHSVALELDGETLTLAHHAEEREIFARGALRAARWLLGRPAGRYRAQDWALGGEAD